MSLNEGDVIDFIENTFIYDKGNINVTYIRADLMKQFLHRMEILDTRKYIIYV